MTITTRKQTRNGHSTEHVSTQRCAICGAERGSDWELFAVHLLNEHDGRICVVEKNEDTADGEMLVHLEEGNI